MTKTINILFVCSRNRWRSPTGEAVWRKDSRVKVRSAGTSSKAKRTVNANDLRWADIIFVMEQKHKNRLNAEYANLLRYKALHVLEIPDEYQYMDSELVEILQESVEAYLRE